MNGVGRLEYKEWLKVELDNLKPDSDFYELNKVIQEIRDLLQKLISGEICLYVARNKLRDLIIETVGYLTRWEEIHPDIKVYPEILLKIEEPFLDVLMYYEFPTKEELRLAWAQESIKYELVHELYKEAYDRWMWRNEDTATEEAKNILYWLYHTLKMIESEFFKSKKLPLQIEPGSTTE